MVSIIISQTTNYTSQLFFGTRDTLDFTNGFLTLARATFSAGQIDGSPIVANGLKIDGSLGTNILTIVNVQNYASLAPLSWNFTNWSATDRVEMFGTINNDSLRGASPLVDFLYGGTGHDNLRTDAGADKLYGGLGNDSLAGSNSNDGAEYFGGSGNDEMTTGLNSQNTKIYGGSGLDRVNLNLQDNTAALVIDIRDGGGGRDIGTGTILLGIERLNFFGGGGNEVVHGGAVSDSLQGRGGSDRLFGGDGDDFIFGDSGALVVDFGTDVMTGGAGSDTFGFDTSSDVTDSPVGSARDRITDFTPGLDKIFIAVLQTSAVNWLGGNRPFTQTEQELRFVNKLATTFVEYDNDGDGKADLQVLLSGNLTLALSDFEF